jgi:predicted NAD/FAD-binding protein
MRVAVVGSGVSGLVVAYLLDRRFDVTLFEADARLGGHVHTVTTTDGDATWAVDTGFIVYNERNYPLFTDLLARLGVATQPSSMSFSVRCDRTGLEYNGSTLRQLFAQRRNLFRPTFYRMVRDILRFNREAPRAVAEGDARETLGEYLRRAGYGPEVREHYLVPMGSALWSIPRRSVLEMPTAFFVQFFEHHGMLTVDDRPEWRVVRGGSQRYVEALLAGLRATIRMRTPVTSVRRVEDHVLVDGERFDHVVLACHADQALTVLEYATPAESAILGALPYQSNDVVLHTDTSVLPTRRRAWGAWNYHIRGAEDAPVTVTYNMNVLQSLNADRTYCVSLNAGDLIDPSTVLATMRYAHPRTTLEGAAAQERHGEISGVDRTHFCGAYWGFGFHEDGVRSAARVAKAFGVDW